ncbi:barstar family protein [Pseudonocardia sp.]|uniref:barstar family protein n=1 Tax=Pseudonocardia sp. TaxID=60912 RepID=UPI00262C1EF1|nr:barstar family protein [Pseudonocardia sp.]
MARRLLFDPATGPEFVVRWQRYDYRLLQNGPMHRVDDSAALRRASTLLRDLGYLVHQLEARDWSTEADLHDAVAAALDFPRTYGRNLDALNDCLADVAHFERGSDPASTGTAIMIDGYDRVRAIGHPRLADMILDIIARQAQYAALVGHPMLCLVSTASALDPVGATPVLRETPPIDLPG